MIQSNRRISKLGTVGTFIRRGACSETSFCVLNQAFSNPRLEEEHATVPFAGGIMQHGYQCGLLWGATLAAGAQAYRLFGAGPKAETKAVIAAQRLVKLFRDLNKSHINCLEITELDKSSTTMQMITYFLIKGGTIGCFRRAAKYASAAYSEINAVMAEGEIDTPSTPVSCAALTVWKMGGSDEHAVMAAGLAGGIGLSGGACGALGAAIWINGIKKQKSVGGKVDFNDRRATETLQHFLKFTDYEFECSSIAGRRFESVSDHAEYIRCGGCAKLLEQLAANQ